MILLQNYQTEQTIAFFNVTGLNMAELITKWVNENLENMDYFAMLNEGYSCTATFDNEDKTILISGDEDRLTLQLVLVSTVAITL